MKFPRVGIFWHMKGRLLLDSTPLASAECYGNWKNYAQGHIERWSQLQAAGYVSLDVEYEVHPRGRVIFNTNTEKFLLLADPCILKRDELVKEIITSFELPAHKTELNTDPHYRCFRCLGSTS